MYGNYQSSPSKDHVSLIQGEPTTTERESSGTVAGNYTAVVYCTRGETVHGLNLLTVTDYLCYSSRINFTVTDNS